MRFSARILSIFVGFIFFLLILAPKHSAFAVTTYTGSASSEYEAGVPNNSHTYTQTVFINVLSTSLCYLVGIDPISPNKECLGFNPKTGKIGYVNSGGGAIGATIGLISYTFTPPASSTQYISYLGGHFGIGQKAYAAKDCRDPSQATQGYGFCSISPLTNTWIAMRDIVYLLLVVVFVVIGVAIMLRVHIDPRTVMTIENQIPKIIVIILLVTFSLAIAGFLIDIMYVAIFLIGNVLHGLIPSGSGVSDQLFNVSFNRVITSSNPFDAIGNFADSGQISTYVAAGMANILGIQIPGDPRHLDLLGLATSDFVGFIVVIIIYILVLIALLIALIRVWMALIVAYVSILLDIVFAPFWFLAGLAPGAPVGISGWFKDILANLAAFPAVIIMFYMGAIFSQLTLNPGDNNGALFSPPMVAPAGEPLLGSIIMFGFIFMTPHIIGIIKGAIKAPKLNLGPIFEPLQAAGGTVRSTFGTAGRGATAYLHNPYNPEEKHARGWRVLTGIFR